MVVVLAAVYWWWQRLALMLVVAVEFAHVSTAFPFCPLITTPPSQHLTHTPPRHNTPHRSMDPRIDMTYLTTPIHTRRQYSTYYI